MSLNNLSMNTGAKTPEEITAHETAMTAKAEADGGLNVSSIPDDPNNPTDAPKVEETAKPEWIPEKFWDAEKGEVRTEAMAKSYSELEKSGKPAEEVKPEGETPPADKEEEKPEGDASPAPFEEVRLAAEAEFTNTGELSEGTYDVLLKQGFSKAMVDQYISGAQAQSAASENAVFESAGTSRDEFAKASEWAAENLPSADIEKFNTALANPEAASFAVKGLVARYSSEADITPSTNLSGAGSSGPSGYRSSAEMVADMSDKRYKVDAAFRAEVSSKIMAAEREGINLFS